MVVSVWTLTLYLAQVNAGVHVYALESDGSVSQGHVYALEPSRSRKHRIPSVYVGRSVVPLQHQFQRLPTQ